MKNRIKKACKAMLCLPMLLAFLFLANATVHAEEETSILNSSGVPNNTLSVDPSENQEGYSAILYNNLNGLPTSEANAIAETAEGFIWIGCYSGLVRFDGNSFERIDSTTGISSVVCLYVDSLNRLWIGTNDSGVFILDHGQFNRYDKTNGLHSVNARAMAEDTNGNMFIATTSGIDIMDQEQNCFHLDDPRLENAYIRDIRKGQNGLVYGLTQLGDLFVLREKEIVSFLDHDTCKVPGIISLLPDPKKPGNLYLGTENAQVYYGSVETNFAQVDTYDIAPMSLVERFEYIDGKIWICAGNGIGSLSENGFQKLENIPMDNSVSHVMTDYEGNLWFTSSRQGVMKIVPNQFTDIFEKYDLDKTVVNSTCMLEDRLFLGTDSGLIVLQKEEVLSELPLSEAKTASGEELNETDLLKMLEGVRIRSITRDSKRALWISTWRKHGLLRYDDGVLTAFTIAEGLFSDRVRVAVERKDGSCLVANTGGVNVIKDNKIIESYGKSDGIENEEILTVAEGFNNEILAGSDGGGIVIITNEGIRHIGTEEGLSSDVVMRIKRDPIRDIYWIVTSNSIAYMSSGFQITTVKNFPYSNNFDLYENSIGEAWILSSNGIHVLSTEQMIANEAIAPVYYSRHNGLSCIATANSYSELTKEGDLYIAGTTGVVKVNIETPFEDIDNLKASVPYIQADGEMIFPDDSGTFNISSSTQKLTIHSFVFNYSLMDPQVSCQLEGFESERAPIARSEMVPVDYTNLHGGTYHFIMRLKDSMGHGSKVVSVPIVKEKNFYEYIQFYIISFIILFLLAAKAVRLYIHRRMQKLEKRNKENMTLISEITEAFAKVIDMKDKYTNGHSTRVAKYTAMLARELGYDEETIEKYYRIALLHDIGKIGVPPEVLNKPGKLTDEEFESIKSHTTKGYEALKDISIMPELAIGAQAHHERPDGRGYPNHLKQDEIPRVAQIIAVADCFDAMYSNRPYRKRMIFEKAVSIIREVSGTQLTPDVVDAFLRLVDKGEFRAQDDNGEGSMENIENIRNKPE